MTQGLVGYLRTKQPKIARERLALRNQQTRSTSTIFLQCPVYEYLKDVGLSSLLHQDSAFAVQLFDYDRLRCEDTIHCNDKNEAGIVQPMRRHVCTLTFFHAPYPFASS